MSVVMKMPFNLVRYASVILCPKGWHIASREEWDILTKQIGGIDDSKALRSTTGWIEGNGTNTSGFTALPAGDISGYDFLEMGEKAVFWTSSPYSTPWEYQNTIISLKANEPIYISGSDKQAGFSCRCVKD